MIWEYFENCCKIAEASLDGNYGWFWEIATIFLIVLVFNFIFKRLLLILQGYFKSHHKLWQESFVRALYQPMSYFVWYFAFIEILDFCIQQVLSRSFTGKPIFLSVGLVLSFAWFLLFWKQNVINCLREKYKNQQFVGAARVDVFNKLGTVVILIITVMLLLEATGNNLNTLIAFGGISGLALAFASQEVIASFFGGLMVYVNQPFHIGDWIILPERSIEGYVEEIGWYTTKVRTFDKRPIYVPNSIFSKIVVVNPSRMSHRQIKETIGIRYRDVGALKGIIADLKLLLGSSPDIDHDMTYGAYFSNFGAYSLDILFSGYTFEKTTDGFNKIKEKIFFGILDILEKHQAELAYPTTCVERSDQIKPSSVDDNIEFGSSPGGMEQ
jgi:MscS family membrane protein